MAQNVYDVIVIGAGPVGYTKPLVIPFNGG